MNKTIRLFLIPFTLSFGLLFAQDDCPNDVEFYAPGEGEPGCIDYTDCNENGAFDYGEPCYDEPPEGETDPVADAYFMALDDGASPEDAFAAATDVVYELEVEHGEMTEEEYQDGLDHVSEAFHEALEGGASPDEAFGAAMAAADDLDDEGEEGGNHGGDVHPIDQVFDMYGEHTWLNCEAVSFGAPSYWIGDMEYGAYPDPLCEQVFIDFYHAIDANDDGAIDFGEAAVVWGDDDESQEIFAENDLNGDGVVDEGEFMDATAPPEDMEHYDMDHDEGDMGSPIDEAYFEALDNGASPQDALAAAEAVAYQLEVEEGDVPEEQFNADVAAIAEAFDQLIGDDVDPHDAYFMALEIVFGGEEDHDDEEHHDGGWYCQICDIHFATEEEMDDHAEEMGHIQDEIGRAHV